MSTRDYVRPAVVTLLIFFVLCVFTSSVNAGDSAGQAGTTSANYLKIGVGARAAALGGAYVALSDDATAGYWNPAGLSQVSCTELIFMHNSWYDDINVEYLGAALPASEIVTFGLGFSYLDYGSFEGYDIDDNPTGEYSANAMVASASASFRLSDNIALGATGKLLTEKLESSSANGLALDLGLHYRTQYVSVGLNYMNIGSGLKYEDETFPLPTRLAAGAALHFFDDRLRLATDIENPNDGSMSLHQGVEYCYENTVFLRSGYAHRFENVSGGSDTGLTLGFGIRHSIGSVDYSYLPDADLGDIHKISFRLSFGGIR